MEIERSPLYRIIQDILAGGATNTNYGWKAVIHYGEQGSFSPLQTLSLSYKRDYRENFTDEIVLKVIMGAGQYARLVYANRGNLQITLQKIPQTEKEQTDGGAQAVASERFSATLSDEGAAPVVGRGNEASDQSAMDLTDLVEVDFQLYNKMMEQLRIVSIGGCWRNLTMENALKSILSNESSKVDVDSVRMIQGVSVLDASNKDVHPQVIITDGTKLVDTPDYLQKKYGIYSAGLGSYIQNRQWHLFPLYDTTRFEDRQQTLTLIVVPKRKFPQVERTYQKVGNSLTVLLTEDSGFQDDSGKQYLREGNGARFADGSKLMQGVSVNTGNKAIMSRKQNVNEFMADKRSDGVQHVPVTAERISANPFVIYSQLAGRRGGYFKAVWENADPKLLVPGMATRILYMDQDNTQEVYGVLHLVVAVSTQIGGITEAKFKNTCIMRVFVHKTVTRTD